MTIIKTLLEYTESTQLTKKKEGKQPPLFYQEQTNSLGKLCPLNREKTKFCDLANT